MSDKECKSCIGFIVLNSSLITTANSTQCAFQCDNGYYGYQGVCYGNFSFITSDCNPACSTCYQGLDTNCITCSDPNKFLYAGSCIDTCPLHYYPNDRVCFECNPSCSACVNETSIGCLNCTDLLFYEGQCLASCPFGTYVQNSSCVDCKPPCTSCRSLLLCDSCDEASFLIAKKEVCVSYDQCPNATYGDKDLHQCANCDISCSKCAGPTANDCLVCNRSLGYADKTTPGIGPCQKIVCSAGQYLLINIQEGKVLCMPCSPQCETCSSDAPTRCAKCKKQYLDF